MRQVFFAGIGAGVAAALLFVAPLGGSSLALPLFLLTGLPVAIAAFGWGLLGGVIAVAAGAGLAALLLSGIAGLMFLALFGAPTLWVVRMASLSRSPVAGDAATAREWYPFGRLAVQAAIAPAIGIAAAGVVAGYDPEGLAQEATAAVVDLLSSMQPGDAPSVADIAPQMHAYVSVLPLVAALTLTLVTVFNVAIGARIVRASGRLERPAEPLWRVRLGREAIAGFAVAAVLAWLLPEVPARFAQLAAGALIGAMALAGLAVVHAATLGNAARSGILGAVYVLTLISGLPLLLLAVVGAADVFIDLRARISRRAPPSP